MRAWTCSSSNPRAISAICVLSAWVGCTPPSCAAAGGGGGLCAAGGSGGAPDGRGRKGGGGGGGGGGGDLNVALTSFPDYVDPQLSYTFEGWEVLWNV